MHTIRQHREHQQKQTIRLFQVLAYLTAAFAALTWLVSNLFRARHAEDNNAQLEAEILRCFIHPRSGREVTTQKLRTEIAARWCAGDFEFHHTVAAHKGLLPIALVIASLLEIDHPLLVSGRGALSPMECAEIVMQTMLHHTNVAQMINLETLQSQPVERILKE